MQTWLLLTAAILLEVAGTTSMKLSDGFSKTAPSVLVFLFYGGSFYLLALTLKRIDVSIAYAVWSALGTALIAIIGIVYFKEPATIMKIASLGLIIAGVVGLNLAGAKH